MAITIRPLTSADLDTADIILRSAFRRSESSIDNLRLHLGIQPDGYWLASQNDVPAGMVGTTIYSNFAYIGMMAVHQSFQRQGVGFKLMQHLLSELAQRHVQRIILDASATGQSMYEKMGFIAFDQVFIMERPAGLSPTQRSPRLKPITHPDISHLTEWDSELFGSDRKKVFSVLLDFFPERAFMLEAENRQILGYIFLQGNRIGPWVALDGNIAGELLQVALSLLFNEPISAVVPAENEKATSLLMRYGFTTSRVNRHMEKGPDTPTSHREMVFGQTSLSLG